VEIHRGESGLPLRESAKGAGRQIVAAGPGRLFLRFWRLEIILGCFQTGRMSQWAQAHFFVGRDGWQDAGASMPGVPAVERELAVNPEAARREVLELVVTRTASLLARWPIPGWRSGRS